MKPNLSAHRAAVGFDLAHPIACRGVAETLVVTRGPSLAAALGSVRRPVAAGPRIEAGI